MTATILPRNYRFAGVHCGIRPDPERLDLALVVSDVPAVAAGVFTQNRVCAAPVQVCRERLPTQDARGVVICSGNANACTGQHGLDDARRMTAVAAESICLSCPSRCSSVPPASLADCCRWTRLSRAFATRRVSWRAMQAALERAARAILTTDTRIKVSSRTLNLPGVGEVRVTGFAKGAAMIGPNMATMLAFVLTDAAVSPEALQAIAVRAADRTFNCISVEGHTSTNDTLLIFANGQGNAADRAMP